jgi:hypothetical protein
MSWTVESSSSSTTASDDTELRHGRRAAHHVEDDDARLRIFISLISSWVAARSSPRSRSCFSTSARSAGVSVRHGAARSVGRIVLLVPHRQHPDDLRVDRDHVGEADVARLGVAVVDDGGWPVLLFPCAGSPI